jgi:hypothetical protein
MAKLTPISSIECSEAVGDLTVSVGRGRRRHGQALGWYRGQQAGIYSAYLTLRNHYPEAAQALIEAWQMNEDGDLFL